MIIVSGRIHVDEADRDGFVAASLPAVEQARNSRGCLDFVVAPDPLEAGRVNVYEEWESQEDLMAFRGEGPSDEMGATISSARVQRHEIASSGPP